MAKAGKSTLLNAIIGEEIAATDAGECTKVVTWYRHGHVPKLTLHPVEGQPRELPIRRREGHLVLTLDGHRPEEVKHLVVDWPSPALKNLTLIDTPGLASLAESVSARSENSMAPDDAPSDADAIIYLMRHLHSSDVKFLEALQDPKRRFSGAVSSLVVLSRVDEIGAGRIESLVSAGRIADRYRQDKKLRRLSLGIIPVAGLLAQTARTLRQSEYVALAELAKVDRSARERTLLSTDIFLASKNPSTVNEEMRTCLVNRFGIFGIRLAVVLIQSGSNDATTLAQELARRSGLDELLDLLQGQFQARAAELKIRSVIMGVDQLLKDRPRPGAERVSPMLERLLSASHEPRELRLLMRLRSGAATLPREFAPEAEQLLGGSGTSVSKRLGLPEEAYQSEIEEAALAAVKRWRTLSEHPLSDRAVIDVCRTIVRTCEGIIEDLQSTADQR
ncbi:dynamin family protein [Arthrobacter sp. ISL-95]|uniref:dynamin family protein n=1 Tax=Arthrobacter sp. ISL-95 TaxID=2819116 RepID=UPI002852ED1D|nr:dynamin family protein [Arthrobacter sp. ISL-95]